MLIFLSNYWWQKSDIWSQASYRYPISWEAFLDPSDSYFLFAEERGYHKWALAHSSSCFVLIRHPISIWLQQDIAVSHSEFLYLRIQRTIWTDTLHEWCMSLCVVLKNTFPISFWFDIQYGCQVTKQFLIGWNLAKKLYLWKPLVVRNETLQEWSMDGSKKIFLISFQSSIQYGHHRI